MMKLIEKIGRRLIKLAWLILHLKQRCLLLLSTQQFVPHNSADRKPVKHLVAEKKRKERTENQEWEKTRKEKEIKEKQNNRKRREKEKKLIGKKSKIMEKDENKRRK